MKTTKYPIQKFDERGNKIYHGTCDGWWVKTKWDRENNIVCYGNDNGWRDKNHREIDGEILG